MTGTGATRAAAGRRSPAVRREGLRGHERRGDRGAGRSVQAGRLRALRRQGGPLRRRRRPRDPGRCSTRITASLSSGGATRGSCSSARRSPCSTTSRTPRTASGSSCATPPSPSRTGTFASLISDVASQVEHLLADEFRARGLDPKTAPLYAQMLVGHGRPDRPVLARPPHAEEGRGRRAPGQPRLERARPAWNASPPSATGEPPRDVGAARGRGWSARRGLAPGTTRPRRRAAGGALPRHPAGPAPRPPARRGLRRSTASSRGSSTSSPPCAARGRPTSSPPERSSRRRW